jgi:hypothetical protein
MWRYPCLAQRNMGSANAIARARKAHAIRLFRHCPLRGFLKSRAKIPPQKTPGQVPGFVSIGSQDGPIMQR